jgi:ABC-type nitrate/sulfonate/bicarbonate transport system substrate-binding protein
LCLILCFSLATLAQPGPTLRISLPPVLAALPIAFAEEWELFDAHGVNVEIVGMTDNEVRSAALSSGNLDLVMEDVTQFLVDIDGGQSLIATSAAFIQPQTASLDVALVSPGSFRLDTVDALLASGYMVGTVFRSDHEYLLDRLFETTLDEETQAPRYAYMTDVLFLATWFGAQMMPAVVLPEPYISYIAAYAPAGGVPVEVVTIADLSGVERLPHLVVVRADFLEAHPEAIDAFYTAYGEAIERLNGMSREELVDAGLAVVLPLFFQGANPDTIGQDVLDALSIPTFELPVALDEEIFSSVLTWTTDKGYTLLRPEFVSVVDLSFVP